MLIAWKKHARKTSPAHDADIEFARRAVVDLAARRLARRCGLPPATAVLIADLAYGERRHG
jgi:hypothetical protein